jgi:hypothetical protein
MFTRWDKQFDEICGSAIVSRESEPLEDSGVWDLLHGTKGAQPAPAPKPTCILETIRRVSNAA